MSEIERTISLEVTTHCCRVDDGSIGYTSEPNRMTYGETSETFEESLVMWRDRMLDFIKADLDETVDKELCQKVGGKSLRYCVPPDKPFMEKINVEETEIIEAVPEIVEVVPEVVVPEVVVPEVVVPEVKISEIEKQAALGRIIRIEQQLFGTALEAVGRMEIERLKKIYGI